MWSWIASALASRERYPWIGYAASVVAVALALPLVAWLERWMARGISVYLLPVVLITGLFGRGPGLLAVVAWLGGWMGGGIWVVLPPGGLIPGLFGRGPGLLGVVLAVCPYDPLFVGLPFPPAQAGLPPLGVLVLLLVAGLVNGEVVAG